MDGFTSFRRLPRNSLYTKPFKSKRSLLLGFLLLVCLRKRAFDTASKQKTRHSVTGFAERKGFEPSIRLPAYTLSRRAPSTTRTPLYLFISLSYARPFFHCIPMVRFSNYYCISQTWQSK